MYKNLSRRFALNVTNKIWQVLLTRQFYFAAIFKTLSEKVEHLMSLALINFGFYIDAQIKFLTESGEYWYNCCWRLKIKRIFNLWSRQTSSSCDSDLRFFFPASKVIDWNIFTPLETGKHNWHHSLVTHSDFFHACYSGAKREQRSSLCH